MDISSTPAWPLVDWRHTGWGGKGRKGTINTTFLLFLWAKDNATLESCCTSLFFLWWKLVQQYSLLDCSVTKKKAKKKEIKIKLTKKRLKKYWIYSTKRWISRHTRSTKSPTQKGSLQSSRPVHQFNCPTRSSKIYLGHKRMMREREWKKINSNKKKLLTQWNKR